MFEPSEPPPRNIDVSGLNSDWKIIKPLNWIGVMLAAATPYDFSVQEIVNLKVYRYYSIALIFLTVFGFVHALVGRHVNVYPYTNLPTITMDVLTLTTVTCFNCTVLISTAFCTDSSETLLGSLIKNDMFLQPRQRKGEDDLRGETRFKIKAGVLHFLYAILIVYDSYVWIAIFGTYSIRYYFFKNFQCLVQIFVTLQFCETLKFIGNRFKFSIGLLMDLVNEMHKFPEDNAEEAENGMEKGKWTRVSQKIKPRQEDIMQLKLLSKIFDTLFDSVELFNGIFRWKVLFLICNAVLEVLQTVNFLIAYGSGVLTDSRIANGNFIVLRLLWMLFFVTLALSAIQESVSFANSNRNIALSINNRLLEMPVDELLRDEAQEELATLGQQFMYRPLSVDAVFIPNLSVEFVFNVILSLTSFTPVLIQFNRV